MSGRGDIVLALSEQQVSRSRRGRRQNHSPEVVAPKNSQFCGERPPPSPVLMGSRALGGPRKVDAWGAVPESKKQ